MTPEERDELINSYSWQVVDDMDLKTLCQLMAEQIAANFDNYTDEEIISEVTEYYPHLLNAKTSI